MIFFKQTLILISVLNISLISGCSVANIDDLLTPSLTKEDMIKEIGTDPFQDSLDALSTGPNVQTDNTTKINFHNPQNKTGKCKLGIPLDFGKTKVYWDGKCKNGFAYGNGLITLEENDNNFNISTMSIVRNIGKNGESETDSDFAYLQNAENNFFTLLKSNPSYFIAFKTNQSNLGPTLDIRLRYQTNGEKASQVTLGTIIPFNNSLISVKNDKYEYVFTYNSGENILYFSIYLQKDSTPPQEIASLFLDPNTGRRYFYINNTKYATDSDYFMQGMNKIWNKILNINWEYIYSKIKYDLSYHEQTIDKICSKKTDIARINKFCKIYELYEKDKKASFTSTKKALTEYVEEKRRQEQEAYEMYQRQKLIEQQQKLIEQEKVNQALKSINNAIQQATPKMTNCYFIGNQMMCNSF